MSGKSPFHKVPQQPFLLLAPNTPENLLKKRKPDDSLWIDLSCERNSEVTKKSKLALWAEDSADSQVEILPTPSDDHPSVPRRTVLGDCCFMCLETLHLTTGHQETRDLFAVEFTGDRLDSRGERRVVCAQCHFKHMNSLITSPRWKENPSHGENCWVCGRARKDRLQDPSPKWTEIAVDKGRKRGTRWFCQRCIEGMQLFTVAMKRLA